MLANDHHQRCEPAAKGAGIVTDSHGWLASAAWCVYAVVLLELPCISRKISEPDPTHSAFPNDPSVMPSGKCRMTPRWATRSGAPQEKHSAPFPRRRVEANASQRRISAQGLITVKPRMALAWA